MKALLISLVVLSLGVLLHAQKCTYEVTPDRTVDNLAIHSRLIMQIRYPNLTACYKLCCDFTDCNYAVFKDNSAQNEIGQCFLLNCTDTTCIWKDETIFNVYRALVMPKQPAYTLPGGGSTVPPLPSTTAVPPFLGTPQSQVNTPVLVVTVLLGVIIVAIIVGVIVFKQFASTTEGPKEYKPLTDNLVATYTTPVDAEKLE